MKSHRVVIAVFVFALLPLLASVQATRVTTVTTQTPPQPAVKVIELKATKYKFTPDKIEIPLNTVVQFKITAVDNEHGFEIEGVKDSCVTIPKGTTKTVEYKADKAGTIKFKCCHVCGLGHGRMHSSFVVK